MTNGKICNKRSRPQEIDLKHVEGKRSRINKSTHWRTKSHPRLGRNRLRSFDRLKRTRGAKKGIVTKAQNEIRELMLDFGNIELVQRKVQILQEFEGAYAAYHEQLKKRSRYR